MDDMTDMTLVEFCQKREAAAETSEAKTYWRMSQKVAPAIIEALKAEIGGPVQTADLAVILSQAVGAALMHAIHLPPPQKQMDVANWLGPICLKAMGDAAIKLESLSGQHQNPMRIIK
jgi:hypothetical protein